MFSNSENLFFKIKMPWEVILICPHLQNVTYFCRECMSFTYFYSYNENSSILEEKTKQNKKANIATKFTIDTCLQQGRIYFSHWLNLSLGLPSSFFLAGTIGLPDPLQTKGLLSAQHNAVPSKDS